MDDIEDDPNDPEGVDTLRAELRQGEYIMQVGIGAEKYYMVPDTEECAVGPLFKGDFPDGKVDNQNLNISYLSGDYLNVPMGFATAFGGDGVSSGILGLDLRGLTTTFTGNSLRNDSIPVSGFSMVKFLRKTIDEFASFQQSLVLEFLLPFVSDWGFHLPELRAINEWVLHTIALKSESRSLILSITKWQAPEPSGPPIN
ncbi:hypothetical protein F5Y06DRAFT_306626 [Hypoxylon sp. FL0890]|nr:hypothetical protein F5Y06DRAFT_306626 [Hypoxylon sp. FL0890]